MRKAKCDQGHDDKLNAEAFSPELLIKGAFYAHGHFQKWDVLLASIMIHDYQQKQDQT